MKIALFLMAALFARQAPAADRTSVLQSRIAEAVHAFRGDMGVAVVNLDTGEAVAVNGDQRFPTASLIKVAVMVEVYHQIAEGKLRRRPDRDARRRRQGGRRDGAAERDARRLRADRRTTSSAS